MANVQFANPFGAYVGGQQAGLEDSIRAGTAARQFRSNDLENQFMKWYQPLREREATAATGEAELNLNKGVAGNAANLTAFGGPGQNYLSETLNRMYPGYGFGNVTANSAQDLQRAALQATGQGPSPYDPMFSQVGHYGAVKKEVLSPEEYSQAMTLRYGPGWQTQQPGAQATPRLNPYEAATNGIFGPTATGGASGVAPTSGSGGVTSYGAPKTPAASPGGNPHEYGNGLGIFTPMETGGAAKAAGDYTTGVQQ